MNSFDTLKQNLLFHSAQLLQAAREKCTDPSFVYDTIYLAVIKIKQRYKKIVNQDRVAELCVAEMKQPKKHVKQSFASVEECIEMALTAKVVPWKPVISAVAVVLVAAILIPVALPKQVRTVDASGFVMEGSLALENLAEGGTVELKNLHLTENLGAADPQVIAGHKYGAADAVYNVYYDSVTTSNGVTLLILLYVDETNKKAEYILYEAHEDGWKECHRVPVGFFTQTQSMELYDEANKKYYFELKTFYYAGRTAVLPDTEGNVYILSRYAEGIQIHRYNADGSLTALGQQWLAEYKNRSYTFNNAPAATNLWGLNRIDAALDTERGKIAITGDLYLDRDNLYYDMIFLEFDIKTQEFTQPITVPTDSNYASACYDGNGGWYFIATSEVAGGSKYLTESSLFHFKDGQILSTTPLFQAANTGNYPQIGMLTVEDGKIHLVYYNNTHLYHAIYSEDGEQLEKKRFYAVSSDRTEYMYFFLYGGKLHSLSYVSGRYLILSQVQEDGTPVKLGEFLFPASMDYTRSSKFVWERSSPGIVDGNIINVMIPCSPNGMTVLLDEDMVTYFMQIALPEETDINK